MIWLLLLASGAGSAVFLVNPFPKIPLLLALGLLLCGVFRRRHRRLFHCVLGLTLLLLGACVGAWQIQRISQAQLPADPTHRDLLVQFEIDSIPQSDLRASRFFARITPTQPDICSVDLCTALRGKRVRLSWFHPPTPLAAGQVWQATLRLKRPRGMVNPGGFDYHAWLLSQAVVATGYVREAPSQPVATRLNLAAARADLQAQWLPEDLRYRRFYQALLVGDKSAIDSEDWAVLQATGTIHLMAISGLHIGLVATIGYWLGAVLARVFGLWPLAVSHHLCRWLPPLCSCLSAAVYAAMAGFAIPTVRALVMCWLVNACLVMGARVPAGLLYAAAMVLVVLLHPFAWLNSGFWLSFLAVGALLYGLSNARYKALPALLKTQGILAIALLVPILALGQPASVIGPLANLIAVPVVSLVVVPGLFIAGLLSDLWPTGAGLVSQGVDSAFHGLWTALVWFTELDWAIWWPSQALRLFTLPLAAVAVAMVWSPNGLGLRPLGSLILGLALWGGGQTPPDVRLTVMDVGQGQALVLSTREQTWVIDTGPRFSDSFDAGTRILLPYLLAQGVHRVSLMVTHNDLDHSGGFAGLAGALGTERLVSGEPLTLPGLTREPCVAGQQWTQGLLRWHILWPAKPDTFDGNNGSCVALIQFDHGGRSWRLLLTGDIEATVERKILPHLDQPVDVLLAPHHGSRTSSSAAFVTAVDPRYVVFSSGYRHHYGHPHPDVQARYTAGGSQLLHTGEQGAVVMSWHGDGDFEVITARERWPRAWH